MGLRKRWIGEVDEHPLAVAQRRDPHQGPDRFDVASGLADEPAYLLVGQLDLDRDGTTATLERLDQYLLRFLGPRLGPAFDHRSSVDSAPATRRPAAPH